MTIFNLKTNINNIWC